MHQRPVALIGTGVGVAAAPAIGGAIGSTAGLTGAAATSHGLAVLGGGALATGGLGMAGGTAAVALGAAALGGVGGGILVNKYVGDIQDFDIKKRHKGEGENPRVVFVNGFLSQGESLLKDWKPTLKSRFEENPWMEVGWESKHLRDLGGLAFGAGAQQALGEAAKKMAVRATKLAGKKLGPLASMGMLLDIGGNAWWVAMVKAQQTGQVLADLICRTAPEKKYILLGHSLGARVLYFTLQALTARDEAPRVQEVHLLGGAVSSDRKSWQGLSRAVSGTINNYYSKNDDVLRYLYPVGTLFQSDPIGRNPIEGSNPGIRNHNVTSFVDGHTGFKPALPKYIRTDA